MTSLGAEIVTVQFMSTFKHKRQIYHKASSIFPFLDSLHKFLQMSFIGDSNDELNTRCGISIGIKRSIVSQLQELLHGKKRKKKKQFKVFIQKSN